MATLNPNLRSFWETQTLPCGQRVVGRVLHGGRMSSKSHDAAGMAIAQANFSRQIFLCTRMYQNRIADSVYSLLVNKIGQFGLASNFKIYTDAIEHVSNGSLFRFYGVARNIDEIKSFEGATRWWNEESHGLTEVAYNTIRPTIMRNEGAEMWMTLNPQLATDFSYKRLVADPPIGFLVRQINYPENPFLNEDALAEIEASRIDSPETFGHVYLGEPMTDDDLAVIKSSWINAVIDAHLLIPEITQGASFLGYDIADSGADKCATVTRTGGLVFDVDEWKGAEDELLKSTTRAYRNAAKHGAQIVYDSIGVGASAGAQIAEINKGQVSGGRLSYSKFNAGAKVIKPKAVYEHKTTNEDFFANLKAQAWWTVADRFRLTYQVVKAIQDGTEPPKYKADQLISICSKTPKLSQLKVELSTPRRDFDNNGRVKVESKKDLAKREVASPNIADAFVMAFAPVSGGLKINSGLLQ